MFSLAKNYKFIFYLSLVLVLLLLPIFFTSSFMLTLFCKIGVLIIFSVAYNMLLGQTGLLSFGHAIYFGLAGYASVHILNGINSSYLPSIPIIILPFIGALVGLILGIIIGYLSTKRLGTAFAMISLGFCELVTALTLIFVVFFNGEDGIQADRVTGNDLLGLTYGPQNEVYYLILFWCIFTVGLMYLLTKTPFGTMCNAVRDNQQRAEFVGYNVRKIRWMAFSLSAMFAGAAGSLHAINYEHIGFESVSLAQSGMVLFMAYIGGIGTFLGPILGAISLTYLDTVLSGITEAWLLYFGLIFIIVIAFAPQGLAGIILMHEPILRINPSLFKKLIVPYIMFFLSICILIVGFTSLIELIHALRSTHETIKIYWISVDSHNVFVWLLYLFIFIVGIVSCNKTFKKIKEIWHYAIENIKLSLMK
ncbi:branched-chain amino acid ABC transporter permease [Alphaproteobacteria bacterium]|nr:branched-chain amino acid ABC transporter permease [Alphaproteobacteria bacterium]